MLLMIRDFSLRTNSTVSTLTFTILLGMQNGPARAQQADGEEELVGPEIIVTSRKLEEPLQRLPFGATVFDAGKIEREGIRDARTFGRRTPGFNFVDTGLRGSNIPNIRGVGSFFPQSADDASVPVFIDGVPTPVRSQDREFFDVQRIEVLRGPQNTIYGRNAQAGAINITTADPTEEPYFEIRGEVGNLSSGRAAVIASGPLGANVLGRLSAQFDTRGGDIADLNLIGDDAREQDIVTANGKVIWDVGEATEVRFGLRYGHYDEQVTQGVLNENPDFPQLFLDFPSDYDLETIGAGLTITHDFADVTLTALTGLQYYTSTFDTDDTDGLVFQALTGFPPAFSINPNADFRSLRDEDLQISQELRLDGEIGDGGSWVAGVNFFRSDLDFDIIFNSTGFINADFDSTFTTTSFAGFGEAIVPITDALRVSGGLRLTYENKDFSSVYTDLSGFAFLPTASDTGDESFFLVTGRAAVTYDLTNDVTAFVSASRGAKSGGFQLTDTDLAQGGQVSQFESAFTWSYEAGVRGSLMDGAVDFSLSGFFTDTTDEHVQVFDFTTFQSSIENIDTETYGFEIEGAVRPVDGLTLSGGFALLETEITASADPTVTPGNEVPFAPQVSFNAAIQYEHPLELFNLSGDVFSRAEYQFVGSRTIDPQNSLDLESFDIINLRAGWDSDEIGVYAFVDNLLDESYSETAFLFGATPTGSPVSLGIPGQPRRFGVGGRVRF
ncbi:MAG: TonB-dependent receptor [Pseudomonadota bacterium]